MVMTIYRNSTRRSGVRAYEIGTDRIRVRFADGSLYDYTHAVTGRTEVEQMKRLARAGEGLCTFINQHVHNKYAARQPPPS